MDIEVCAWISMPDYTSWVEYMGLEGDEVKRMDEPYPDMVAHVLCIHGQSVLT